MTVGEAMERAEELRPGSRVAARTRQRWLCEEDGMLRACCSPAAGCGPGRGQTLPGLRKEVWTMPWSCWYPCLLMRSTRITSAQSWMLPWRDGTLRRGAGPV
mgnify:CR=1 FL=1